MHPLDFRANFIRLIGNIIDNKYLQEGIDENKDQEYGTIELMITKEVIKKLNHYKKRMEGR